MDPEQRNKIVQAIADELKAMQNDQNADYNRIFADSRENMRNFSLVVGAVATGSLVILGSQIPIIASLVIYGISTLLFELVLIFGYLFHKQRIAAEESFSFRKKTILLRATILTKFNDLNEGRITNEQFDQELRDHALREKEFVRTRNEESLTELSRDRAVDKWDLVFFAIFLTAFSFISFGILIPQIFPNF